VLRLPLLRGSAGKVPRLDSFLHYLELSRNRFPSREWRCRLIDAGFTGIDPATSVGALTLLAAQRGTPGR
jgi:hypothetical protein